MGWKTQFKKSAQKQLAQIDKKQQQRILAYLSKPQLEEDPRCLGKPLKGQFQGLWRYRVGMYRVVCDLQDQVTVILVVEVDKRGEIYR